MAGWKPKMRTGSGGVGRMQRDTYGKNWFDTVKSVQERDGGQCMHPGCRVTTHLHTHHIIPLSRGGTTRKSNLITLCETHHEMRHGHSVTGHKEKRNIFKKR